MSECDCFTKDGKIYHTNRCAEVSKLTARIADLETERDELDAALGLSVNRNAKAVIKIQRVATEADTLQTQVVKLTEALKPFANFACDLAEGEECACHNCIAKAALTPEGKGDHV